MKGIGNDRDEPEYVVGVPGYVVAKAEREQVLVDSSAVAYDIDRKNTHSRVLIRQYTYGARTFNYDIEVVIAPRRDLSYEHAGEVTFLGNLNSTPSIDGGEGYFDGCPYSWSDKNGVARSATSVSGILHQSGFDAGGYYISKKRVPSLVYLNVKTPCPDFQGPPSAQQKRKSKLWFMN